ncbi:MAG TPA: HAD family hydrolase [Candidatus Hydrogenedentes bacterium]|nr:HAD family hydrolase [Candidatus Hydrogenedentota bacterium]HPJ98043.1 HAD family hydrolase [Candidatus Hydrogenedentota bacterium]
MAHPMLIIFDVDGTLLQSHRATVPAIREVFLAHGLTPPSEAAIQETVGMPVHEYEAWLAQRCPQQTASAIVGAVNERELEFISTAGTLFPGVLQALQALKRAGHALATCTNASVPYLARVLEEFSLRKFFQINTCIGQGYPHKTAMVRHIMNAIQLRPAVVVGDRAGDIEAAKANGAYAIAACYGYGAEPEFHNADAHAHSVADIVDIVSRLGGMPL